MSSSSHRHCRYDPATAGWASLPRDILLDVFLKLGPREVMLGAEFACLAWRRTALEEPSLWRRIGMESPSHCWPWRCVNRDIEAVMMSAAVDRAAGQCEAFKGSCDEESLIPLVERAPSLKSLDIELHSIYWGYDDRSGEVLVEALKKLTLLEDLHIYFHYAIDWEQINMLQSVCQAYPRLKKLVMMYASGIVLQRNEDEYNKEPIDGEIPVMGDLHTLELYDCDLSCKGLNAILDSCPALQNLHIDGYFNKQEMVKELKMKCARVKNLTLPGRVKPGPKVDVYYGNYWDGYDSVDEDNDL
ncbi:unnamed protein product [Urochloa decumbens]|uniref:F-box domain-containing protein n=1 Tax=Urochloa decumbens TaxID=240449 RepID=A0ABC9BMC5_9POAL